MQFKRVKKDKNSFKRPPQTEESPTAVVSAMSDAGLQGSEHPLPISDFSISQDSLGRSADHETPKTK